MEETQVRLGYMTVSAERGQLSWNLKGLQPEPKASKPSTKLKGTSPSPIHAEPIMCIICST